MKIPGTRRKALAENGQSPVQTIAIVANGQIESLEQTRPLILRHSRVVAVDGGLIHCQKMGIRPSLIVGDFDSCPSALLDHYLDVPKITLPKEKDETDLEVALREEEGNPITLYGAWGHRIDHSLANALLLTRWPGTLQMETERELLFAIDKRVKLSCFIGQILSLIPLNGPVSGIATKGLKWELHNGQLDQNFIGISNICLKETVEISVKEGSLICCVLKAGSL